MTTASKRILVVDDDPSVLQVLDYALREEGYEVHRAADGEEALHKARRVDPDLIVLDVMLPKMDGFEVCAKLRALGDVPILLLSARGAEMDKVVGFNVGADDYLTKPFPPSELVLRMRAILRRASHEPPVQGLPIRFKDMEINRATRTVVVRGQEVDLTPKEFDLLWFLASHPGHVFSRDAILQRVWQTKYTGDEAALTVCVRRLREKIEKDPSEPELVRTVWGIGYKFDGQACT